MVPVCQPSQGDMLEQIQTERQDEKREDRLCLISNCDNDDDDDDDVQTLRASQRQISSLEQTISSLTESLVDKQTTIDTLQLQVVIYRQDFQSERQDRERAQSQIVELQTQLNELVQQRASAAAASQQVCQTSLSKVIWEEGPVAALSHTYTVKPPLVTIARPKFSPKSTPSRRPIPKPHYLPHPWTRPTYDAKRHPDRIRRFSTMHWTDRCTYGPTDRQIVHWKV